MFLRFQLGFAAQKKDWSPWTSAEAEYRAKCEERAETYNRRKSYRQAQARSSAVKDVADAIPEVPEEQGPPQIEPLNLFVAKGIEPSSSTLTAQTTTPTPAEDETTDVDAITAADPISTDDDSGPSHEIQPGPKVAAQRGDGGSSTTTQGTHEHGDTCYFCDHPVISTPSTDHGPERKAYLPCGHYFGHRCLHERVENKEVPLHRCPRADCIGLTHACQHYMTPMVTAPEVPYTDNTGGLPWMCEFCTTPSGQSLIAIANFRTGLFNYWRQKCYDFKMKGFPIGIVMKIKTKYHRFLSNQAENRLKEDQKHWSDTKWKYFAQLGSDQEASLEE